MFLVARPPGRSQLALAAASQLAAHKSRDNPSPSLAQSHRWVQPARPPLKYHVPPSLAAHQTKPQDFQSERENNCCVFLAVKSSLMEIALEITLDYFNKESRATKNYFWRAHAYRAKRTHTTIYIKKITSVLLLKAKSCIEKIRFLLVQSFNIKYVWKIENCSKYEMNKNGDVPWVKSEKIPVRSIKSGLETQITDNLNCANPNLAINSRAAIISVWA